MRKRVRKTVIDFVPGLARPGRPGASGEGGYGESVRGRPLRVRTVTASDPIANCHLLFVPAGPAQRSLLSAAANHPILTVGDDPAFLDDGGMIALRVVNGRVRFEIDDAAARRVGLRISSQLLGLAVAVRGGGTR